MDKKILETVENKYVGKEFAIDVRTKEFTCLCPEKPTQPDYAKIRILYCPDKTIVELKSLKLYFVSYRDTEIHHESATNQILADLVEKCKPIWMEIEGNWNIRGGVTTVVRSSYPHKYHIHMTKGNNRDIHKESF